MGMGTMTDRLTLEQIITQIPRDLYSGTPIGCLLASHDRLVAALRDIAGNPRFHTHNCRPLDIAEDALATLKEPADD
jgi:hypothetical protein